MPTFLFPNYKARTNDECQPAPEPLKEHHQLLHMDKRHVLCIVTQHKHGMFQQFAAVKSTDVFHTVKPAQSSWPMSFKDTEPHL